MSDRNHFEEYRDQTLAKHTIVEKYLYAFFNIMKTTGQKNLVYIDGFAGRGTYTGDDGKPVPGSPIRALQKIASLDDVAEKVTTFFIEKDPELFKQLEVVLAELHSIHPKLRKPRTAKGTFAEQMNLTLDLITKGKGAIAPAFVFIDPCGVDGVDFDLVDRLLRNQEKLEVFVFFNIEGVRRILGLKDKMGPTLVKLLGSEERTKELLSKVGACKTADEREQTIIRYYEDLLRHHTPAKYVVSFRVEREDKKVTSHYLVHASQNPRGFAIMKDVMWRVGKTAEGKGGLALEQASSVGMEMMFRPEWEAICDSILERLKSGMKRVSEFTVGLVEEPDNRLCEKAYKTALLELEADGKLVVINKNGIGIAKSRPTRNGAKTLGDDYYVMLP